MRACTPHSTFLLSSSHRRLRQDYRSDHYPRHHLRITIISQQLGLFHFASSPSSPSSLPSSAPTDDTYHPLFICLSHFVSSTPTSSTLVALRTLCRLAESAVVPPSRSKRERERDRRWPRGQRLHQQQLRCRCHPRAFLCPHLCRPGILSLQATVRCKKKKANSVFSHLEFESLLP